jgi:hypothetical protein
MGLFDRVIGGVTGSQGGSSSTSPRQGTNALARGQGVYQLH